MLNSLLNLLFPRQCCRCHRLGTYLCPDCLATIPLATKPEGNIYFATNYKETLVKRMITSFTSEPFAEKLSQPLVLLIISYLKSLEKKPPFLLNKEQTIFVPAPLSLKEIKKIGFHPAYSLARILGGYYEIPVEQISEENNLFKNKSVVVINDIYPFETIKHLKGPKNTYYLVVARSK